MVFDRVLLLAGDAGVKTGAPTVAGARVEAKVLGMQKGPKLIVFHKWRRKNARRKNGHRQRFTDLEIQSIQS